MRNCIFCEIINQEIPNYKMCRDDKVYTFLDISQATKGHTLVVPERHIASTFEYDPEPVGEVFSRVPKIAQVLEKAFPEIKGLNILSNNRELIYQSVFHSHIHLVPHYSKEDDFSIHSVNHQDSYGSEELEAIQEAIVKQASCND